MSAVDKYIAAGLASGEITAELVDAERFPEVVARELYPILVAEDFAAAKTTERKQELLKLVQKSVTESRETWNKWLNTPMKDSAGKQIRAKHTSSSLFTTLARISGTIRQEGNDAQTEQVEQPTLQDNSQSEPASEVMPPPPPRDEGESSRGSEAASLRSSKKRPSAKKAKSRKKSHSEIVQEARTEQLEASVLSGAHRRPEVKKVDLNNLLRIIQGELGKVDAILHQ